MRPENRYRCQGRQNAFDFRLRRPYYLLFRYDTVRAGRFSDFITGIDLDDVGSIQMTIENVSGTLEEAMSSSSCAICCQPILEKKATVSLQKSTNNRFHFAYSQGKI